MESRLVDSDPSDSPLAPVVLRDSRLMRGMNAEVRRVSGLLDATELIAFFCECQAARCYAPVFMSGADYDAAVAARTGWVLREGHEPSTSWDTGDAGASSSSNGARLLTRNLEERGTGGGAAAGPRGNGRKDD